MKAVKRFLGFGVRCGAVAYVLGPTLMTCDLAEGHTDEKTGEPSEHHDKVRDKKWLFPQEGS